MSAAGDWASEMEATHQIIQDEAHGMVQLHVVSITTVLPMIANALQGAVEASRLVMMIAQALDGIQKAPRDRPMLCASCPRPLRKGRYSIVVALPDVASPKRGFSLAICERCATKHADINASALRALRSIWPNLKPITHREGGHA